jgi:hypothetical protein
MVVKDICTVFRILQFQMTVAHSDYTVEPRRVVVERGCGGPAIVVSPRTLDLKLDISTLWLDLPR